MNKICYGCGIKLQSSSKDKVGYVPLEKIDSANYCMRCFRMIHYGENKLEETPKDVHEIINKINKDDKFVIFLVDFLNINQEVIKIFKSIKKEKILIVNKCELIPKHINKDNVRKFIREYYQIIDPIKIKGGMQKHGASSILKYLEDAGINTAYILGISNSGKSTLINDLIDICCSEVSKTAVNNRANTTLDFLRVKLNNKLTLIDSPGFILNNSLNHDVRGKIIKAFNFNIKECETVKLIDDEIYLKFDSSTPIIFYTNSLLEKPIKKYFKAASGLVNELAIDNDNTDIIINGVGFITIKKKTNITTNIDLKYIEIRNSMFGGYNE